MKTPKPQAPKPEDAIFGEDGANWVDVLFMMLMMLLLGILLGYAL